MVPFYHDLAERFNLCEDPANIESMNLIYNVTESPPRLYITAVKKNRFIIKRIIMDEDFTRITRQSKCETDFMATTRAERVLMGTKWTNSINISQQRPATIRKPALWAKAKDLVLRELRKDIDYGRTIRYDDLVLSIKGGENKGIFI